MQKTVIEVEKVSLTRDIIIEGKYHYHLALRSAAKRFFTDPCPYCNSLSCLNMFSRNNEPFISFYLPNDQKANLRVGRLRYCRGREYLLVPCEVFFPSVTDIVVYTAIREASRKRFSPNTTWSGDHIRQCAPQLRNTICSPLVNVIPVRNNEY